MEEVLARIYYQPKHLWKGQKALKNYQKKVDILKQMLKIG